MKDLTKTNLFDKEQVEKKNMLKRVIKSSEWNSKLNEIKEWKDEQERLKHQKYDAQIDSHGSPDWNEQVVLKDTKENSEDVMKASATPYEKEIIKIRRILKVPGSERMSGPASSMNMYSNPHAKKKGSFGLASLNDWSQFGTFGYRLTGLEDTNNQRLLKNSENQNQKGPRIGLLGRRTSHVYEPKELQDFRMKKEKQLSLLFTYRLSGFITLLSIVMVVLKMNLLIFFPSWSSLIAGLIGLGYTSYALNGYDDGPLNQNYLGSDERFNVLEEEFDKEWKKKKELQEKESKDHDKRRHADRSKLFGDRKFNHTLSGGSLDFDDEEDDDGGIDDHDEVKSQIIEAPVNVKRQQVSSNNAAFVLPPAMIDTHGSNEKVYLAEESFLEDLFRRRGDLPELHKPSQILELFAPLIADYNQNFASVKEVKRGSDTFNNIAYLIGKYYSEISPTFKKSGKHDEAYYYAIDKIMETGLFYKVKIKLPDGISNRTVMKTQETFKDYLKDSSKDSVDAKFEIPNDSGYIKIFKMKTDEEGKTTTPLVSTGDVLRFKGMKTTGGKPVLEALDKPGDLTMLFGLSNSEDALVYDIGADQNVGISVAGFTGSGKTASTGSWLVNMLVTHGPDEVGVLPIDVKSGSFWANFKYAPHVMGFFGANDVEKMPTITEILNKVHLARQDYLTSNIRGKNYAEVRKMFKKKDDWERVITVPRLIIVLDEQKAMLEMLNSIGETNKAKNANRSRDQKLPTNLRDAYLGGLGKLAVVVRESGITFMALSQRTIDKAFPRDLLASSTIKFAMKLQIQADAERLMGQSANLPDMLRLPTGSGYMMANGLETTQLATPLFSGDPQLLEELTRIIGLAWVIIQDTKEDLALEPQGYWLTQSSKNSIDEMRANQVEPFNLFNRDKIFNESYKLLKDGKDLHYDMYYKAEDFSIDLASDGLSKHFSKSGRKNQTRQSQDDERKIINVKDIDNEKTKDITDEIDDENPFAKDESDIKETVNEGPTLDDIMDMIRNQNKEYQTIHKEKDDMDYEDLNDFFKMNNIKSIDAKKLMEYFNSQTVKAFIRKRYGAFDEKTGKIIYLK